MRTKRFLHVTVLLLVLLCLAFSIWGCSWRDHVKKFPAAYEFPNTEWRCREVDLVLYLVEGCDPCGTYFVNEKEYRVRALLNGYVPFTAGFYGSSEETVSKYDPELLHREDMYYATLGEVGYVSAGNAYLDDAGLLVFTDVSSRPVDGETIPETLTFEKVGAFAPTPKTRWVAEGLDLYLDSYSDADWYFKGEITLDGEKQTVQAVEIGGDHHYVLWVDHCPLIFLSFDISEDMIVATATDDHRSTDLNYEVQYRDWYNNYKDVKTITFHPTPIE